MQTLLKAYKMFVSPIFRKLFGGGCRYTPTCSEYTKEAINRYGILSGLRKGVVRFLSCHPFSRKDYWDPVK